jgi:hypothetical protein
MPLNDRNSKFRNEWLNWPFAGLFFAIALMICVAPGVWGAGAIAHGRWFLGAFILLIWGFPFFKLISFLNAIELVRFSVSIPCLFLILITGFLLPDTMFYG